MKGFRSKLVALMLVMFLVMFHGPNVFVTCPGQNPPNITVGSLNPSQQQQSQSQQPPGNNPNFLQVPQKNNNKLIV